MQTLSWSRSPGTALHSSWGAPGFMEAPSTGPHVLCRFGEGVRPFPLVSGVVQEYKSLF